MNGFMSAPFTNQITSVFESRQFTSIIIIILHAIFVFVENSATIYFVDLPILFIDFISSY